MGTSRSQLNDESMKFNSAAVKIDIFQETIYLDLFRNYVGDEQTGYCHQIHNLVADQLSQM